MRPIHYIKKQKIDEESFIYKIDDQIFKIYKLQYSCQPLFPWRLEHNNALNSTIYGDQHTAEGMIRSILSRENNYQNAIFSFDEKQELQLMNCECGKNIHNFFNHSSWCPQYGNSK